MSYNIDKELSVLLDEFQKACENHGFAQAVVGMFESADPQSEKTYKNIITTREKLVDYIEKLKQ